jgi:CHAD domain-containing protein
MVRTITQTREREQKFDLPGSLVLTEVTSALPDHERAVLHEPVVLSAIYFDTDAHTLLDAQITVRRRSGGADEGWHLKEPDPSPSTRGELQVPIGSGDAVPEAILTRLVDRFGPVRLHPVFVVRTERTASDVFDGDQFVVELDHDVVVAVDLTTFEGAVWQEVEVEVHSEGAATADVTSALLAAGATLSPYPSKLAHGITASRAMASHGTSSDAKRNGSSGARVTSRATGTDLLTARVRAQVAALIAAEADVRLDAPDSVHRMRVAVRRLRSCLRTFRSAFERVPIDHLLDEIEWLADHLGPARDAEVTAEQITDDLSRLAPEHLRGSVVSSLGHRIRGGIAAARVELEVALDSRRYLALLESLVEFGHAPPLGPKTRDRRWLERRFAKTIRKTDALVADAMRYRGPARDERLHRARKSAKRVRYAAETLSPLDPKRFDRAARRYEAIQELLGAHHDAVVTRLIYQEEGAHARAARGDNGFSYGVLFRIEDERANRSLADFKRAWKRLQRHSAPTRS